MDVIGIYRASVNRFSVAAIVQDGDVAAARKVAVQVFPDTTNDSWTVLFKNFKDYRNAVAVIEDHKDDGVLRYSQTVY